MKMKTEKTCEGCKHQRAEKSLLVVVKELRKEVWRLKGERDYAKLMLSELCEKLGDLSTLSMRLRNRLK